MGRFLAGALGALLLGAIAACGSSSDAPSDAGEGEVAKTVRVFLRAGDNRDATAVCRLLTDNGKAALRILSEVDRCGGHQPAPSDHGGPTPHIGPVGVEDDVALAVWRFTGRGSYEEENFVAVLRRIDGRWLIDLAAPFPVTRSVASGSPSEFVEELPTDGEAVDAARAVAGRFTVARQKGDGAVVCGLLIARARRDNCEGRESVPTSEAYKVAEVTVVGDVALAYRTGGGIAHDGQTQPDNPGELQDVLLLRETSRGWRVDPITFGFA